MVNKFYVYALVCPINRIPFYIGKGCGKRAWRHLTTDRLNKKKSAWIDGLRSVGKEPEVMIIMSDLIEEHAYHAEKIFINECVYIGIPITNRVYVDLQPPRIAGDAHWTKGNQGFSEKMQFNNPMFEESNRIAASERCKTQIGIGSHNFQRKDVRDKAVNSLRIKMVKDNPMHRPEVLAKLKGKPTAKIECPHCKKIGGVSQMKRYHFDKCKIAIL